MVEAELALEAAQEKDIEDTAAAKVAIELIDALPESTAVTVEDAADIEAARKAFDILTKDQQAKVPEETLKKLTDDETALEAARKEESDQAAATTVTALLNSLPESEDVTVDDKADIEAGRAIYDALTDDQKKKVPDETLKKLTDAETALAAAEKKDADDTATAKPVIDQINELPESKDVTTADKEKIEAARKAYNELTDDQKDKVSKETFTKLTDAEIALGAAEKGVADTAAVKAVTDLINSLPSNDEMTVEDKPFVDAARATYEALSPDQKKIVTDDTLKALVSAENMSAALPVIEQIGEIPASDALTLEDKQDVEAARKAYDALTADQKANVSAETLKQLTDAEAVFAEQYTVTAAECKNGTVSADKASAVWGDTITVTPTPAYGYVVKAVYVDDQQIAVNDKGLYQFEMFKKNVTVSAEFEKQSVDVIRAAGDNRYATAAEISKLTFGTAETVVLAYGDGYADALAGIPLAAKLNAPVLLTRTDDIPQDTLKEIKRLGAKNVIILGGEGVISNDVVDDLKDAGLTADRIAGKTRFDTATKIAELVNDEPEEIFFVYGFGYADALSINPIAAIKNAPIIYLRTDGDIDEDTAAYLEKVKGKVKKAYVIGGTGVISDEMAAKAAQACGLENVTRVAGDSRYNTSVAVNEQFKDVLTGEMLCVATGTTYPDALAGGLCAAMYKSPLMLVNTAQTTPSFSDEQKAYLQQYIMDTIVVFGGTGAVPEAQITALAEAAGCKLNDNKI